MNQINTWPGWDYVRQIGKGAFGKVYEIKKEEFGRTYRSALKVITIPKNQSEIEDAYSEGMDEASVTDYFYSIVEDITEEFGTMSDLKGYTNIVSYEDHMILKHENDIGWDILIRMQLLTPLKEWIVNHPLSESDVIKLGCDICKALEICHAKKIIHRDIKPENIFVNNMGDFVLGDFGISRTLERTVADLSKKGTFSYMAPEVYRGNDYGASVDLYSLGIVLYRFLNGNRTPFLPQGTIRYMDKEEAFVRRMKGEVIPEPINGSPMTKTVILKALEYLPENRYQTVTEFHEALISATVTEGIIQNEPLVEEETMLLDDPRMKVKNHEEADFQNVNSDMSKKKRKITFIIVGIVIAIMGIVCAIIMNRLNNTKNMPTQEYDVVEAEKTVYERLLTYESVVLTDGTYECGVDIPRGMYKVTYLKESGEDKYGYFNYRGTYTRWDTIGESTKVEITIHDEVYINGEFHFLLID